MKKWVRSLNFAIEGVLYSAKTQRHVKFHFFSSIIIILAGVGLGVSKIEFAILCLTSSVVIITEILNSAIEVTVDLITLEKNKVAGIAKDVAAGAVLVASSMALIVGYIIFKPIIRAYMETGYSLPSYNLDELLIASFVIVLISVIILKSVFGKGLPLRGGMPSGHASLSFSVWVSFLYIYKSPLFLISTFIIAVLISLSRVYLRIHTVLEITFGAIVGSLISYLMFFIFR